VPHERANVAPFASRSAIVVWTNKIVIRKSSIEYSLGVRVRIGWTLIFSVAFFAFAILIAPAARAQSDDAKKQAQALQVEGVRLLQKGDNRGALAKFNEAFALVQSPKIMFNMGKAYRALGNDVEALRAFDTFLDEAPFAPKASRAEAEREAQGLRPKLAYIEVESDDSGSAVRIDGREVGKAPLVRPVVVAPGSHEVKLEKAGMVAETRSVAPIAGQKLRVVIKLSPVRPPEPEKKIDKPAIAVTREVKRPPASTGAAVRRTAVVETDTPNTTANLPIERPPGRIDSPPVETSPSSGRAWQTNAAWVSAGVGVLALGGGVAAQVLWSQKNTEFNNVKDSAGNPVCTTARADFGGGSCPGLHHDASLMLTLAIAGYATAGAAAIASVVFALTAPSSHDASAPAGNAVSLGCLPTVSSSGLSCTLTTRF
jgi:hypothetical protein